MIYSDSDILSGFAKRDERVFEVIYKRYYKFVYSLCYKIYANTQDCQDNTITVFEKLFSSTTLTFVSIPSLEGYLSKASRNKSINSIRAYKNRGRFEGANSSYDEYEVLNDELDYQYIRAVSIIQKAMSCYPTRGVQVLHMIYFEEKTHIQIAEELGISLHTVPNLRKQGLDHLLKRLSK